MPFNNSVIQIIENENKGELLKHFLYTGAIGTVAANLLGGVPYSDMSKLGSVNMSQPLLIGASIAAASVVALVGTDIIVDNVTDTSVSTRDMERQVVSTAIAGFGGSAAMQYVSGIDMSLNSFLLSAGSNILGGYTQQNFDKKLLGMLW